MLDVMEEVLVFLTDACLLGYFLCMCLTISSVASFSAWEIDDILTACITAREVRRQQSTAQWGRHERMKWYKVV